MKEFRFWIKTISLTLGKLCQQRLLLAGAALLCFFLPTLLASAAETVLAQGISFSGVKLAITAPAGDPVPEQLEQVLTNMSDIKAYCQVEAMDRQEALDRLEQGKITAILALPAGFIQGILNGTNPDAELIVRGDRPLEALLTFWIGQSASDMLAAFQSGIYAVLELYQGSPPDGLTYDQVVAQINLRYITWMMNRQDLFRTQTVSATGQIPTGIHYGLSLLAYFGLSLAPLFMAVYDARWIRSQRRFRAVGRGSGIFYGASLASCWLVEFVLLSIAQLALLKGSIGHALLSSALCGLFCAAFCGLCCLLTPDTGSCGLLSFGSALVFLVLSGGILPPVLLPHSLRELLPCWPVTWMRNLMAASTEAPSMAPLILSSLLMTALGWFLYARRGRKEAADP